MKFRILLLLIAIPMIPPAAASAQTAIPISVTMTDFAFAPGTLDLKAGMTYQLHFINSGSKDHNFTAPEFFAAAQIAPEDQAKLEKGAVALGRGQSADVTLTPAQPGTFSAECTHFMHKMMGMHGSIIVQ